MTACSICGDEYTGYGNNAQPVNDGRCCDSCNQLVIRHRLNLITRSEAAYREGVAAGEAILQRRAAHGPGPPVLRYLQQRRDPAPPSRDGNYIYTLRKGM